jgi:RNA polymerase subunit RPABC4/transcription elongation factor Spt4
MDCYWGEAGYWMGWPWINLLFLMLLFGAGGYIIYRITKNGQQNAQSPSHLRNHYSARVQKQCPNCHAPVEEAYLCCPECHFKLKTNCQACGKIVKTNWDICPYCETKIKITKEQEVTN